MRVVIFGATGGLGYATVLEAHRAGHSVRALVRDPCKLPFPDGVELVVGNANNLDDVRRAVEGCGALCYCLNVSWAGDWVGQMKAFLGPALEACRAAGAKLVFPGNVFVFGKGKPGELVNERRPLTPCSAKGRARVELERRLAQSGVRFTILRLPEFYGPNVTTLMGPPFQNALRGKTIFWPASLDLLVEFVYMPDAAAAMVEVAAAEGTDGALRGPAQITPRHFLGEVIQSARSRSRILRVPALLVRAAGLFSTVVREATDVLHLWTHPILLDGTKYCQRFGRIPATPYNEAISATLSWFADHPEVKTGLHKT